MPPGSRQAMPMIAIGLRGAPSRNGPNKAPSSQQLLSCAVGCLNRWVNPVGCRAAYRDDNITGGAPVQRRLWLFSNLASYGRSLNTIGRRRIAVGGSGARCHGCDSCTSVAVNHSSDRSAAGFPVDCSSGPHRCGPAPMRGAGRTTRWLRHRSRSGPTERRRVLPDVVAVVAVDPRLAGFEPTLRIGIAADRRLTCITAVDLLAALREWRTATATLSHAQDITAGYRQPAADGLEPPIGIEPMRSRLQVGCSTTELRRPAGFEFIGSLLDVDHALRRHGPRR